MEFSHGVAGVIYKLLVLLCHLWHLCTVFRSTTADTEPIPTTSSVPVDQSNQIKPNTVQQSGSESSKTPKNDTARVQQSSSLSRSTSQPTKTSSDSTKCSTNSSAGDAVTPVTLRRSSRRLSRSSVESDSDDGSTTSERRGMLRVTNLID